MTTSSASKSTQARLRAAEFAATTSGHGYHKLLQPSGRGSPAASLLWLLCMLGALAGLGFHIYLLASQFFAYEKRVLTFHRLQPLPYPKVVLCPTNYWSDYLMSQSGAAELVKKLHDRLCNDSIPYYESDKEAEREADVDKILLDTYSEGRLPELDNVTAPLETFLLSCSFNYRSCSAANFSKVLSDRYGFCYAFQPTPRMIYGGYDSGLTLTLAYEGSKEAYLTQSLRYSRGYVVLVSAYDKFINFFRAAPVAAAVGFRTDISLLLQRTNRLASPNDPCTDRHLVVNQLDDTTEFDFDSVNCVDMSLSQSVYRRCGCVSDLLPVPPNLITAQRCMRLDWNRTGGFDNLTIANLNELFSHKNCQDAILRSYEDLTVYGEHVANCQKACKEDSIVTHASLGLLPSSSTWSRDVEHLLASRWQATSNKPSFIPALINTSTGSLLSGVSPEKHIVQLSIFFASSTMAVFEEDWQYPTESFLSEAGGTLGLWMGASVLTVVEVLELFASLLVVAFSSGKKANNIDADPQQAHRHSSSLTKNGNQTGSVIQVRPVDTKEVVAAGNSFVEHRDNSGTTRSPGDNLTSIFSY